MDSLIGLEHVDKIFPTPAGSVVAIKDVSVEVRKGEFFAIVGPSGCGKSTLLRIIAGVVAPTTGRVLFKGNDVTEPPEGLGMVFQLPVLMPWRNVIENVLFPAELLGLDKVETTKRAKELLDFVGLTGFEELHSYQLSGGMQQRVALCRALVTNPDVLLMDEPFAALDAMTREKLDVELVRIQIATGKTIIFVTHSIPEAVFLSDRIALMSARPGRIVMVDENNVGKPRNMLTYGDSQFGAKCIEIRSKVEWSLGEQSAGGALVR